MAEKKDSLYPFQEEVRSLILQGKNVILQAPTGAGKTQAALAPFIQNLEQGAQALPHKCLYATPQRTLTTQFYERYSDRIAHIDRKRGTDFVRRYARMGRPPVSIQTGEQPDDPQFESLLTFCTIDQLLASFIGVPYSVGRRLANINTAAVLGSYLVLDEFHLYPLIEGTESCFGARTTTIAMLSLLKDITRFVLMTATFSQALLEELKLLLNAEIVTVSSEELQQIAKGRQRTIEAADAPMTTKAILALHKECSLVICNTVSRAQAMYWNLKEASSARDIELILLHSRLTTDDRTVRSKKVINELGQVPGEWPIGERYGWKEGEYYGKNLIVVATQAVEVGLDISVQTLHTEIAPANSLIQRAGRCARFAGQKGMVVVYDLPELGGRQVSTKPYEKELCENTLRELKLHDSQQPFGFIEEQALINAVHTEEDTQLIERFKKRTTTILSDIFTGLKEHTTSVVTKLIRDVAQVRILIHDHPEEAIETVPWSWQSFSIHPATLAARMEFFETQRDKLQLDWICKQAIPLDNQDDETDSRQVTRYTWDVVPFSSNHKGMEHTLRKSIVLVLPNALATYHDELGFLLLDEQSSFSWTPYQSTFLASEKKRSKPKPIRRQSYTEHINGLVYAYNIGIAASLAYIVERLEVLLMLPKGSIDQAMRLTMACHDLGKLNERWQQWAWEWQHLLYERKKWELQLDKLPAFFAKTDYDSNDKEQRQWQRVVKTERPKHACESVMLGRSLIADSLGITTEDSPCIPLAYAIFAAIARHHTADGHKFGKVCLKQGALEEVRKALESARQKQPWSYNIELLETTLDAGDLQPATVDPLITIPLHGKELETWLYFVIVRALRLADQHADDFN